ncbi:YciI family protein [Gilvimarinus sp. F26214L]|uniref:YciI family protein n=1 Tax=Gilvimarinus sp. DZF01 TaxID=3461371 RepID=UPI004045846D
MKYMLLIYGAESAWTPEERSACMDESTELSHDLARDGKYLGASPLHPVSSATSVKVRDGKTMVTDGPFAETAEQLGGYYLVDVANLDEAIAIAERIPGAKRGTVEVRPVEELPNLPGVG